MSQLLTYKIQLKRQLARHQKSKWQKIRRKIVKYLRVGRRIAKYSVENKRKKLTSKSVKHLGKIPSAISNQIIRKYKNNKKCKRVSNVNLIVPACSTRKYPSVIHNREVLNIKPLKLRLRWHCPIDYTCINQVEVNKDSCFITVTVVSDDQKNFQNVVGVDLNVKHNLATVGNPDTKEVTYLGQDYIYRRVKYKAIRQRWQRQGRLHKVKNWHKEQKVMNDLNHKLSNKIIDLAFENKANVCIEDLKGIRQTAKSNKSFRYFLNSWQFYKLRLYIEYKGELEGIQIKAVDPKYTSQDCSGCGARTKCNGKKYVCSQCGIVIHRDENASYNIAERGR